MVSGQADNLSFFFLFSLNHSFFFYHPPLVCTALSISLLIVSAVVVGFTSTIILKIQDKKGDQDPKSRKGIKC